MSVRGDSAFGVLGHLALEVGQCIVTCKKLWEVDKFSIPDVRAQMTDANVSRDITS